MKIHFQMLLAGLVSLERASIRVPKEKWISNQCQNEHNETFTCCQKQKSEVRYNVFTPNLFGSVQTNSCPFAWLIQLIWAGAKAVSRPLPLTKQQN